MEIINTILNNEYNIYVNIENNIATIHYPTFTFYYNENCSEMFRNCSQLQLNLNNMQGRFNFIKNATRMFANCYNITGSPLKMPNAQILRHTYINCHNITGPIPKYLKATDMYATFFDCYNLTGIPVCGENVTNLCITYYNCRQITGSPVCGPNVTDMSKAYYFAKNLTGAPVCGPNVVNMYNTYKQCQNLTGPAVCGDKVVNFVAAYYNCKKIYNAVIGNNVTNASEAYYNVPNIGTSWINFFYNGSSAVNATNCFYGYDFLNKDIYIQVKPNSQWNNWWRTNAHLALGLDSALTWEDWPNRYMDITNGIVVRYGETGGVLYLNTFNVYQKLGVKSQNITNLQFLSQKYFRGGFPTSTTNITQMANAGSTERGYFYTNKNSTTLNFYLSENYNQMQIYFNANSSYLFNNMTNLRTVLDINNNGKGFKTDYITNMAYMFNNCNNLWLNIDRCNLYNVVNMAHAFDCCRNITGQAQCGPNVTNMYSAYCASDWSLYGPAACGDKVTVLNYAYSWCYNITSAILGNSVTSYDNAYMRCLNLQSIIINCPNAVNIGYTAFKANWTNEYGADLSKVTSISFGGNCNNISRAFCETQSLTNIVNISIGDKVTNMYFVFYNCYNMIGLPVCGPNVTDMSWTYTRCYNLIGTPVCGPKVTNMAATYINCYNLTGNIVIPTTVTNLYYAFFDCRNISTVVIPHTTSITMANLNNMCHRLVFTTRLNVIIANKTTYTTLRGNTIWANATFTAAAPYSGNILVDGVNYVVQNYAYNKARNVYLYCLNA